MANATPNTFPVVRFGDTTQKIVSRLRYMGLDGFRPMSQSARDDVLLAARIIERQAKALEAVKERLRVDDPHDLYDAVCDALMPIAGKSST